MELFPEIEPYNDSFLDVSPLHSIHFEECGNPNGIPIVFVHGGPGAGISPVARRFFNPEKWRIILFSQRGSGKSTPFAELKENDTWSLVQDMESLRTHLNVDQWAIFGGSWGSTLALTYGIKHSDRCLGFVLRGIFLSRKKELLWLYQDGASRMFPDNFDEFIQPVPEEERGDMITAYYKLLTSEHDEVRHKAARAWSKWEGSISRLIPNEEAISNFEELKFAEAFARIECHYFINNSFFPTDNYILENCHKLKKLPMTIVQGRYDVVCPPESAWDLHKAFPQSKLLLAPTSGHSTAEKDIYTLLLEHTEALGITLGEKT